MDLTKCPFCGSNNISQVNSTQNKVKATGISLGLKAIFGGNPFGGSVENILDKNFQCNDCHNTWDEGFENTDTFVFEHLLSEFENGKFNLNSHIGVLKLVWSVDACIYNITSCKGQTGYSYSNGMRELPSSKIKRELVKLKLKAYLRYVQSLYESSDTSSSFHKIAMTCSASLYELTKYLVSEDFEPAVIAFKYLKENLIGKDENLEDYRLVLSSITTDNSWYDYVKWIVDIPMSGISANTLSSEGLVDYYLRNDFRLSLWMLCANQYGSIAHITSHPYTNYSNKKWEEDLPLIRTNFRIPDNEKIIFFRDNTFFSTKHNQGLVITDTGIYYIENNASPNLISFKWNEIIEAQRSNGLFFKYGSSKSINIQDRFFTKWSETFNDQNIHEIMRRIYEVMSDFLGNIRC